MQKKKERLTAGAKMGNAKKGMATLLKAGMAKRWKVKKKDVKLRSIYSKKKGYSLTSRGEREEN